MGIVLRLGHDDALEHAPAPAEQTMRQFQNCVTTACLFVLTTAFVAPALAQSEPLKGAAAFGDWYAD